LAGLAVDWRVILRPSVLALHAVFGALNLPFFVWSMIGNRASDTAMVPTEARAFFLIGGLFGSPWYDLQESPWPLSLLVIAGGFVALRSGRAGWTWCVATLIALPLIEPAGGQLSNARYHLVSVHLACGLAGLSVDAILKWARLRFALSWRDSTAAALAAVIPMVASLPRIDFLWRMWTPQREHEFFRAGLGAIGDGCTVVTFSDWPDAGLVPVTDPGRATIVDIKSFRPEERRGCLVYYRAASCASLEALGARNRDVAWHDVSQAIKNGSLFELIRELQEIDPAFHPRDICGEFEKQFALTPIVETTLPNIPFRGERYLKSAIPVGFFWMSEQGAP
jgi:hypothetical protein